MAVISLSGSTLKAFAQIFKTVRTQGGTVNNVGRDFINNIIENHFHFGDVPVPLEDIIAAYIMKARKDELSTHSGGATINLAPVAASPDAVHPPDLFPSVSSNNELAVIHRSNDTHYDTNRGSPLEICVIVGIMDALMKNSSLRHSAILPEKQKSHSTPLPLNFGFAIGDFGFETKTDSAHA